jgi:putative redox protein
MATAKTIYLGELRTEATHLQSSTKIITDAPIDNHGKGEAFSPTDLVATALGSCMMTLMGIYARRESIDLQGTEISITKVMSADPPRRIVEVQVIFDFPKNLILNEKYQSALKNTALTCPVALSLHPDIRQTVTFNFA